MILSHISFIFDLQQEYVRETRQQHSLFRGALPKFKLSSLTLRDSQKGIPDVVRSYAKFIDRIKDQPVEKQPQLIICGHGSVDDPDGAPVYDQTIRLIENEFAHLKQDIVVIRLDPSDQLLNAILSLAKVALQLSLREGFEVKVSEALHKVIALPPAPLTSPFWKKKAHQNTPH